MQYLLGIDFGGGASKATLLGTDGRVAAVCTTEYPTLYPRQGWAEQNPLDWYRATKDNIKGVLEKSGISAGDILAVAFDAATHTAVLLDADFQVLRPAIYWTDTRCRQEVQALRTQHGAVILEQAKHHVDTIWTLPQLLWVKEHEPEVWQRTKRILFAKDFVRHQLTGDYVTDYIEAEGSMLVDYRTLSWSEELCGLLGIWPAMLPQLVQPAALAGNVTAAAAADTGLAAGTPVLCGTTDTVMEVLAAGGIQTGQMTVKMATAGRICVITDRLYTSEHLVNYSHVQPGLWYPGTATKSCAASLRWYRDTFGQSYKELDEAAAEVPAGCSGLQFHPYLNGELTPYADPDLCASFTGIRAGHTKAWFNRAVLEGVAYSLMDCQAALEQIGIPHNDYAVAIGGGAQSPLWRQILADALGIRLMQMEHSDSSFGTAMLAGVATGVFSDYEEALQRCNKISSVTEPDLENHRLYQKYHRRYKQIHDALAPVYHEEVV